MEVHLHVFKQEPCLNDAESEGGSATQRGSTSFTSSGVPDVIAVWAEATALRASCRLLLSFGVDRTPPPPTPSAPPPHHLRSFEDPNAPRIALQPCHGPPVWRPGSSRPHGRIRGALRDGTQAWKCRLIGARPCRRGASPRSTFWINPESAQGLKSFRDQPVLSSSPGWPRGYVTSSWAGEVKSFMTVARDHPPSRHVTITCRPSIPSV